MASGGGGVSKKASSGFTARMILVNELKRRAREK